MIKTSLDMIIQVQARIIQMIQDERASRNVIRNEKGQNVREYHYSLGYTGALLDLTCELDKMYKIEQYNLEREIERKERETIG